MSPLIEKPFREYMMEPTPAHYDELRHAFAATPGYDPYSSDIDQVEESLDTGGFNEALDKLMAAMKNRLLSPRAHMLASFIHHKLGDEEKAEMEAQMSGLFLAAILESGDGTRENPYLVMSTSDVYDVLRHLKKELAGQALVHDDDNGRAYDHMTCNDGTDYWFDITLQMTKLQDVMNAKASPNFTGLPHTPRPPLKPTSSVQSQAPTQRAKPWWKFW